MGSAAKPASIVAVILEAVFLAVSVLLLRGYVWPTLSSVEVAVLQAKLDPNLFARDFVVQESLGFTPRFYFNTLILTTARLGLPLAGAYALWQLVAVGALTTGLRAVAKELGLGNIAAAALVTALLTVTVGTLGDTTLYTHAPVPAVWAASAVAWGAALALRQRWLAAFALFGLAALLQFLVGFYAGLLALPLWYRWAGQRDPLVTAPWILGLVLVYLPLRLSGGTGSNALSGEAFVSIYAFLRHPHHLIPTSWHWSFWAQATLFYAGALWFLRRNSSGKRSGETFALQGTLLLTATALAGNWLLVEVWPTALAATLQPARITPLAQGLVLALLASRGQARLAERDWAGAALFLLIPFTLFPGFLLAVAAALPLPAHRRWSAPHAILALAVLLAFQPFDPSIMARGLRYGLWLALFAAFACASWLARRPGRLALAAVLALATGGTAAHFSLAPDWPPFLQDRLAVNARPTEALGRLGERFRMNSPADSLVLTPPGGNAWLFRLHAQRAVVVEDKDFPFTESGMVTWRDRMNRVLGTAIKPGMDLNATWASRRPEELVSVAREFAATHVLTHGAWHPQLPGFLVDREQGWTLWRLP